MRKGVVQLRLDPNRCDRCGRCVRVCKPGALKIGASYIYVDWRACDECYLCVKACDRGAITRRDTAAASGAGRRAASKSRSDTGRQSVAKAGRPEPVARPTRQSRASAESDGPPAWTLAEAGAVLAVLLAAFVAKDAVLAVETVSGLEPGRLVMARAAVLGVFYAVQLGVLWFIANARGLRFSDAFGLGRSASTAKSRLGALSLVVLLLVGTRAAGWIYGVLVRALGWYPPERANADLTDLFGSGSAGLALTVGLVVLVGPLVEEMIFRGALLGALSARWRPGIAISVQAALFAIYHFTPWLFLPTFLLGIATGWLAIERRSLWPAVGLHVLYNAIPVAIAFWG